MMNRWTTKLDGRKPAWFPEIYIGMPQRRYLDAVPLDVEQSLLGLEATENLLNDKALQVQWWGQHRRGASKRAPKVALVDFHPDGQCDIQLRFPQDPGKRLPGHQRRSLL